VFLFILQFTVFFRDNVFFDTTKSGLIFWHEGKGCVEHASDSIALANITNITVGKKGHAFQKPFAESAKADCCFTIVSKDQTLDIEFKTNKARDSWVRGITALARAKGIAIPVEN